MKLKITVSIEDIKFNANKKTDYATHNQFFYFVYVHKLDNHSQNSRDMIRKQILCIMDLNLNIKITGFSE